MAYVIGGKEETEQGTSGASPTVAAGGAGLGGGGNAQAKPGQNIPAQPSAQLSAYLSANEPQAEALANTISQGLSSDVAAAAGAINPAANAYTGNLYTVPTNAQLNAKVAAAPSSLSQSEAEQYKTQYGASGKSANPADTFETTAPYQDVSSKIQKSVGQADLWNRGNDIASLSEALSPFEGPTATKGNKNLDSLLLSRTPNAYSQIQNAVAPAAGLQGQLGDATSAANKALQDSIKQNMASTDAAKQSAKSYVSGQNEALNKYMQEQQGNVISYNNRVNPLAANLANIQPQIAGLQDAVEKYNNSLEGGPNTSGVGDLTSLFSPINYGSVKSIPNVVQGPQISQIGTDQQYSELAALENLIGAGDVGSFNPLLDTSQSYQAGSWKPQYADLPSLAGMIDPLVSPVIQGLTPNWEAAQKFNSQVQGQPILRNVQGIDDAIAALTGKASQQPWIPPPPAPGQPATGPGSPGYVTPPPPQEAIGPQNGQPGNETWYNFLKTQYPGLSGFQGSYQDYLNVFNAPPPPGGGSVYRPL